MFVTKVTQTGEEDPVPQSGPEPLTGPNVAQQKLQGAIGFSQSPTPQRIHKAAQRSTQSLVFGPGGVSLVLDLNQQVQPSFVWLFTEKNPTETGEPGSG